MQIKFVKTYLMPLFSNFVPEDGRPWIIKVLKKEQGQLYTIVSNSFKKRKKKHNERVIG